ncbi:MAG: hypothetical protein KTR29_06180 [Rhodothermaceae bacterium]|nr:hypothetical protein [Rhodothermaceae bacterium]
MKTLKNLSTVFFLLLFVIASGCDTLNNEEPEVATVTEADLEAASSIMAESLSDQNEGMMANLNDMTANVGLQSLSYDRRRFSRNSDLRPCRGVNREYEREYDDSTGVHSIDYSRTHEGPNCEKTVEVSLNYTFTDGDGSFIARPFVSDAAISEIAFEGTRSGSSMYTTSRGSERSRSFEQKGEWNLSGLLSDVATLDGTQSSTGEYSFVRPDTSGNEVSGSGTYSMELNTVDVTITQSATEEDLENEISGQLQYTIMMSRTVNGETEEKEIEGTVELEGNGRALLRFNGLRQLYRIRLADGDVEVTDANG